MDKDSEDVRIILPHFTHKLTAFEKLIDATYHSIKEYLIQNFSKINNKPTERFLTTDNKVICCPAIYLCMFDPKTPDETYCMVTPEGIYRYKEDKFTGTESEENKEIRVLFPRLDSKYEVNSDYFNYSKIAIEHIDWIIEKEERLKTTEIFFKNL